MNLQILKESVLFKNFKNDFLSSIVVFLVALPLCVGIAVASGLSPGTGIISGIIGGIIVGAFSGSPLQVSGPAAGLIIIIHEIIQNHGIGDLGLIILLAGGIQILLGLLALGKWFRAISPAIIQGMLSGIGLSILVSQFYIMLDSLPGKSTIKNILNIPNTIIEGVYPFDFSNHHIAAAIGILTISSIILWNYVPKRLKIVPPTLFAVLLAVLISIIFHLPIKYISINGNILNDITLITFDQFSNITSIEILVAAISVAFIASAETLLTATAIDKMSNLYKTNYNKEIFAQGIGNSLAGILGVLPITGVIVRSAANIESGAKTRFSAIYHGFLLLVFVTAFPFVFKFIPSACLAAILVYTGYKLINIKMAKNLFLFSKGEFGVYLITIIAIISTNLLEGILIGLVAGIAKNAYKSSKFKIKVVSEDEQNNIIVKIKGNLTFLRLPQIAEVIENIENGRNVHILFKHTNIVDHSIIDLLIGWSGRYIQNNGNVFIDWSLLKQIYPNFGWEKIHMIYPHTNTQDSPYAAKFCPNCND